MTLLYMTLHIMDTIIVAHNISRGIRWIFPLVFASREHWYAIMRLQYMYMCVRQLYHPQKFHIRTQRSGKTSRQLCCSYPEE